MNLEGDPAVDAGVALEEAKHPVVRRIAGPAVAGKDHQPVAAVVLQLHTQLAQGLGSETVAVLPLGQAVCLIQNDNSVPLKQGVDLCSRVAHILGLQLGGVDADGIGVV